MPVRLQRTRLLLVLRRTWSAGLGLAVSAAAMAVPAPQARLSTEVHPSQWPQVQWPFAADAALASRVKALLASMSDAEKVGQIIVADVNSVTPEDVRTYHLGAVLAGGDSGPGGKSFADAGAWLKMTSVYQQAALRPVAGAHAIPLLIGVDAVHGHNNVEGATLFPQNIALGAARDPALIRRIGAATAAEVRATGINWAYAPTIAVPRDDRWGRTYEGYSENPALVAAYAPAMVEGLQGKVGTPAFLDARHVVATAKHYLGDGFTKDGRDQGDAQVSETQLRRIAGAGYPPAVAAGVLSVMASFSSWNGEKMSANKALLTDVLKRRMHFGGFVVGDWNAQGQVPGCSATDCPAVINAGMDMVMAPDSWKGYYWNTLAEVKSGKIPMARLDDAVSRILRVKFRLGLLDAQGRPSWSAPQLAVGVVGSAAHRALARQAVRESLVLLKNNHHVLPVSPRARILVAGEGADSIPMQSGGWTLTWQGSGTSNADFPGATTIWQGIERQVKAAGGHAELSVDGQFKHKPDVAIVVYGEHPYAEFHGDRPNVAFSPGDTHDLALLRRLHAQGIPVVSVFLSGRPLWVNPQINASDAFVAAWLPGSEGEGVADVLLAKADGGVHHDFHGRLAYSWPRTAMQTGVNVGDAHADPQFRYGYGLHYADHTELAALSEVSGLTGVQARSGEYLTRGHAEPGMQLSLVGGDGKATATGASHAGSVDGHLRMQAIDRAAQEDARRFVWHGPATVQLRAAKPVDMSRETNGEERLVLQLRLDALAGEPQLLMQCGPHCGAALALRPALKALPRGQWTTLGIALKCLQTHGVDMKQVTVPFAIEGGAGLELALSHVGLGSHTDHLLTCPAPK